MKLKQALVLAALAVGVQGCIIHVRGNPEAHEFQAGWTKLGERTVDFKGDHDTIHVGAVEGGFGAIGIHVSHAPAEIDSIRITFGDGSVFEPNVRHDFHPGSWSRRIDLPGGQRVIRHVDFHYRSSQPGRGKAHVQLFGRR